MSGGSWHLCGSFGCLIDWLDHWQTMLTGVGAVGAAALSIHYLRKQIAGTEEQDERTRRRRLAAARARLPLSLSDTIHYANESIQFIRAYLDQVRMQAPAENIVLPRPVLPEQAILSFEAFVEATDDDDFAAMIASLISEMQVLSSRLRGIDREQGVLNAPNLESYLMNAAKVHAYAAGMFEYARRRTDSPPTVLDWDHVVTALNLNNMYGDAYPELHAFVERARIRSEREIAELAEPPG